MYTVGCFLEYSYKYLRNPSRFCISCNYMREGIRLIYSLRKIWYLIFGEFDDFHVMFYVSGIILRAGCSLLSKTDNFSVLLDSQSSGKKSLLTKHLE